MVFRFDGMREGYRCLNSSHCMDNATFHDLSCCFYLVGEATLV